jgi:ATP-dependent Clp protease ATP-binding subunit ClpA
MYSGTAQPGRAKRLFDIAATDFKNKIHSRAPGSYEKEVMLNDLKMQVQANGLEGDELEAINTQIETLTIELEEATVEWDKHRAEIKDIQTDIRKFSVLIQTAQQEIDALDNEVKDRFFKDYKEVFALAPEGDEVFKGLTKNAVMNLDRDTMLEFMDFEMAVHRSTRVSEHLGKIETYTEGLGRKQEKLNEMTKAAHQDTVMPTVIVDDVAAEETKTPVGGVSGRLTENLRTGVELMQQTVFGQDHVIKPIVQSLQRAAAGLNDPDRPLGSFMIAGPPGTGKSWTAEQIAVKLFGSKDYYVEINMNDYAEKHTVSALIGAPPGYEGYGTRGRLIEIGQDMPFCVLCLDEIEKAHPDIRQALLAVKGKGYMRGLDGEEADFRNIIIVETSNFGNDKGIWNGTYEEGVDQLHQLLRTSGDVFSPEYLDRNDAVLCAGPLGEVPLNQIVNRELEKLESKAQRKHPELSIDVPAESVKQFVLDHCLGKSGRRSEMLINKAIGDHLTNLLMKGGQVSGSLNAQYNPDSESFDLDFVKKIQEGVANQNAKDSFSREAKLG